MSAPEAITRDEKGDAFVAEPVAGPGTIESQLENFVAESTTSQSLSPEEDRRLLRRIDLHLLPVIAIAYLFQFLDKTCLTYASILGILKDLHLSGSQYSWAGAIYYFGYLVAIYPVAGVLLVRLPVAKVIASTLLIWGAILMLHAAAFNAGGLFSARFFLGVAEAAIAPGFTAIVAMWYKREEQPIRQGAWFMGNVCAGFFGSLIAYAFANVTVVAPWKLVFLFYGALTIVFSSVVFWLLPDTPRNAHWLTQADRAKALVRVGANLTGIKSNTYKKYQVIEALLDPNTWFNVMILFLGSIPNNGLATFQAIIIKGFSFSTLQTLLLQMTANGWQLIFVSLNIFGSTYFANSRTYFMAFNTLVSIAGAAMVRYIDEHNRVARMVGMTIVYSYSALFPMVMAMTSSNCGGFTKKATVSALVFIGYSAGNIIGPNLFFEWEAPVYQSGFESIIICLALIFGVCLLQRWYLIRENRRRDEKGMGLREGEGENEDQRHQDQLKLTLADKTDREVPQFRYVY